MSCFNLQPQNTCTDDNTFDEKCDYNSKFPFKWIKEPAPKGSKLTAYYPNFQCKYDFNLTWKQYVDAQSNTGPKKITSKPNYPKPEEQYISSKLKGNNPGSLSFGDIARKYGSTGSETKKDGQKFAVFEDLISGIAASIENLIRNYNGKNLCQVSAKYQGDYKLDGSPKGNNDCNAGRANRLIWVKNTSINLNVSPTMNLDLNDKNTLFALVYAKTISENGSKLSEATIEKGYNKYKEKNNIT